MDSNQDNNVQNTEQTTEQVIEQQPTEVSQEQPNTSETVFVNQSDTPVQPQPDNTTPVQNVEGSKKTNAVPIVLIVLVSILIVLAVVIIFKLDKTKKALSEYAFNYNNVPYYINDQDVTVANSTATTPARTTAATTKTTETTTIYVSNTMPATTTTTRAIVTTTKPVVTQYTTTVAPTTTGTTEYTTSSTTKTTTTPYTTTRTTNNNTSSTSSTSNGAITTRTSFTTTSRTTTTRVTTTQAPTIDDKNPIKRTVMVYMVGSNLENAGNNQGGAGSLDLVEISKIADENTDLFVFLGGAGKWMIPDFKDGDVLYFNNGKYAIVNRFGNQNMGVPQTLASYINYVDNITDTEYYDLILWNHGGGPIYGYGQDIVNKDILYLPEIDTALKNTKFNKNRKFEFIGFDACLMASVETAGVLAPYANYLIASEESEYGYGWTYDKAFTNASKLDSISLGKQIINTYADSNNEYSNAKNTTSIYTLSLIDLSKVDNLIKTVNDTVKTIDVKANIGALSKNRVNTIEFSDKELNVIDLYMLADLSEYTDIKTAVKDTVVYSNSNLQNANGLSIYYPYYGKEETLNAEINKIYSHFTFMSDYQKFFKEFMTAKNDKTNVTYTNNTQAISPRYDGNKNLLKMELTDEQVKNFNNGFYVIFKDMGDGYYTPVYRADTGVLKGNTLGFDFNRKIVNMTDGGDSVGFGTAFERKVTNKGTQLLLPVIMQNWGDDFISSFTTESGYLRVYTKDNNVEVEGLVPNQDKLEDVSKNKTMWSIDDWRTVQFWNFKYKILDKDGHYTDDWEHSNEQTGYEITPYKNPNYAFFMNDIDSSGYYALLKYVDIYGNVVSSDLIPLN